MTVSSSCFCRSWSICPRTNCSHVSYSRNSSERFRCPPRYNKFSASANESASSWCRRYLPWNLDQEAVKMLTQHHYIIPVWIFSKFIGSLSRYIHLGYGVDMMVRVYCIPRTKYVRGILWFSRRSAASASVSAASTASASADTSSFSR